jgi:hypothetical protein
MTDNKTEAISCPIGEVMISRVVEIQEMMEDYQQIKANENLKGQETFSREQAKIYEEQFESCINDLLVKIEIADKTLTALAASPTSNDSQKMIKDALNFLRQ